MKKMRYSEIDRKISELEEALSGGRVTWTDRHGKRLMEDLARICR